MNTISTSTTYKVSNYPYGYKLKTDKFYSIEFSKGKGFRSVETTMNPKTNKLNNPKKSIYYPMMIMYVTDEGKVKTYYGDFYGNDGKDRGYKFMFDHFDKFTSDEIKWIAKYNIMLLKADIYANATYCGSDVKKLFPLYDAAMNTLVTIANTGDNLWDKVVINWDDIKSVAIPNYNPFKVTSHSFIAN